MKTSIKAKHLTGLLSAATIVLGFSLASQPALAAGVANTKHNLGAAGEGRVNYTLDSRASGEICVFCHTPHGADTSAAAPLWNKALPAASSYTVYTSDTITGQVGKPGAISLACLSCHDGAQAMDNIINAPGAGNYIADGGGLSGRGWTWTGANQSSGKMTGVAAVGKDLRNDHPVGIQYCGGPTSASVGTCKDADFKAISTTSMAVGPWWVDTAGGTVARQKTDMILFKASDASQGIGPQVECATCHDPHSTNATFLRISNSGSAVCLACHLK